MEGNCGAEREKLHPALPDDKAADVVAPKTDAAAPSAIPDWLQGAKAAYHQIVDNASPYLLCVLLAYVAYRLSFWSLDDWMAIKLVLEANVWLTCASLMVAASAAVAYVMSQPVRVFMMDMACTKPPEHWAATLDGTVEINRTMRARAGTTDAAEVDAFFETNIKRLGLGERTYVFPKFVTNDSLGNVAEEFEALMVPAVTEVLTRTGVKPRDIGVLIVASPAATSVPSLSSIVVNRFKLRQSVESLNISGMGCAGGAICLRAARNLLQTHRNTYALVVNAMCISTNGYAGKNKSAVLSQVILRSGGSAVLLSNRRGDAGRAKYEYVTSVRTHLGADDAAFGCLVRKADDEGHVGAHISKALMPSAGQAIKNNIAALGPLALPVSEKLVYAVMTVLHKLFPKRVPRYVPDFKLAFDHFLFHVGGSVVLDSMEKSLNLTGKHLEPSRATLHRWGNVSDTSTAYCLAYQEAKGRVRKGDRVWQIQFGSGFKCASVVWRALRDVRTPAGEGAWADSIDQYPIDNKTVYDFNPWSK
jgi:3-ketoacyl-CoA synthase